MRRIISFLILSLLFTAGSYFSPAFAEFSLTVTPALTRNHINFGEVEEGDVETEEVEIKVTSDTGVRYRITQTIQEPLESDTGNSFGVGQIQLDLLSAATGTMKEGGSAPMELGETELYTSNETGTQDTMTAAYTLFVPERVHGGSYRSSITFNLEPLTASASASLQSVTLDISFELKAEFQLAVTAASGASRLDFSRIAPDVTGKSAELSFETFSNLGNVYRIYQSTAEPLTNLETGESVPEENFNVAFSGAGGGSVTSEAAITQNPVMIYQSDSVGGAASFLGNYQLANLNNLSAGNYEGQLLFSVEADAILPSRIQTQYFLPVRFEMETVFDLEIISAGGGFIQFSNLEPGDQREGEMVIQVRSNKGEVYQVQQMIVDPLVSDSGEEVPQENFEILVSGNQNGTPAFEGFAPVRTGTTLLYTSGPGGNGDTLTLVYRLTVPKETRKGTYRTQLSFILSVI